MYSSRLPLKNPLTRNQNENIGKPISLEKNQYELGNEVTKVSQAPVFLPNTYGDRFIARRYNMNGSEQDFIRPVFINGSNQRDNDILYMKNFNGFWRQHAVKKCLETNFEDPKGRVLLFHDYLTKEIFKNSLRGNIYQDVLVPGNLHKFDWPCLPRRKAIAKTEISHVLKNYACYSDLNVISWSRTGNMAASFGEDLVLWIPKGKSLLTYEMKGITCLQYNNEGKYLAVGVKLDEFMLSEVQIWDVSSDSIGIFVTSFQYPRIEDEVRCIAWDAKIVVCGMLCGDVYVHKCSSSFEIVKKLTCSKHCVNIVQFSTNQTFLAASDDGGNVFVWNFQTFEIVFHWTKKSAIKALIAWHPWKESYLVISARIPASICLIDVRVKAMVACYSRTDELCRIDAITFNPKSAELVVSVTLYDDEYVSHEILVLAALDRVVDLLNIHDGRVRCLIWNADGTMLATAGDDDMLNIWNFFGYSEFEPVKTNVKEKIVTSKLLLGNPSTLR